MTRPAIVIGLGGTGQWVLTFLKKDLLEVGNGTMPEGVRLLAFDTTSETAAEAGRGAKASNEEAVRAGSVKLEPGIEFIPIGANVSKLVTEISQGKHNHLQWFPAKSFLRKLAPASFNLKEGAGQIRQMGRIALFQDVADAHSSKILSHLQAAIKSLQASVSPEAQLEIIIVSSLAGGTGAGMAVDLALLLRAQASRLVHENFLLRGFFVLPRAFTRAGLGQSRSMLARSFAAWRELDRFMIVGERFGVKRIDYHSQMQDLQIGINKRAFDISYLVDTIRPSNSLETIKPEDGLYPALANGISAMLDEEAGAAYTEFVAANLAGELSALPPGTPFHSAIGSFTLKVPVFYAHEQFSHKLSMEALDKFLSPDINEKGIVTRVSDMRNQEVPQGFAGWQAVKAFMSSGGLNIAGREIPNTKMMPLMADVRQRDGLTEDAVVKQWASGGLSRVGHPVIDGLTNISQDEEGKKIQQDINAELQLLVYRAPGLSPSRQAGDTPSQAFGRITKGISPLRMQHYGIDDISGERLRGQYGEALEVAQEAQLERYKKLLAAWTEQNLNGNNPNPVVARSGKLGYVRSFYVELIKTLDYFVDFLNEVAKMRREQMKLGPRAQDAAGRAQRAYQAEKDKRCWFTAWDHFIHPDAYTAQRNYLTAEQRSINVRKDDILLDVMSETAQTMRIYAENTLDEIDNWISHLARSNPGVTSLYEAAQDSLDNVQVNHEIDRRMSRVSELIGEHEYDSNPEFVEEALSRLEWNTDAKRDKVDIDVGVNIPRDDPEQPPIYRPFRREGEKPTEYNLRLITGLSERPFHSLRRERPLAREVMNEYETGTKLADNVNGKAEPLYMTSNVERSAKTSACYIRVDSDLDEETAPYFKEFESRLGSLNPGFQQNLRLVDSEDKYKMTIIRSDDLMPSETFNMYDTCRQAYIDRITDKFEGISGAELHIFPAEINACYYEELMPRMLKHGYRTLHPEVVALLEDREKFEMFFRAVALGFIRREEDKGKTYWVYQLKKSNDPLFITEPDTSLHGKEEDIFQVIHNFVIDGSDQRQGVGFSVKVKWNELREKILSTQYDLGYAETVKKYRTERDKGLVPQIEKQAEARREAETDEKLKELIGREYQDLADIARVVYTEAIDSVKK